jgi:hypothetical protein
MNHKVGIIIPSTVNVDEVASVDVVGQWVSSAKTHFANLFGGFTCFNAVGGWMSAHGIGEEPVTIVSAFTDELGLHRLGDVKAFAAEMATGLSQEAVAIEVDHRMEFVSPLTVAA